MPVAREWYPGRTAADLAVNLDRRTTRPGPSPPPGGFVSSCHWNSRTTWKFAGYDNGMRTFIVRVAGTVTLRIPVYALDEDEAGGQAESIARGIMRNQFDPREVANLETEVVDIENDYEPHDMMGPAG